MNYKVITNDADIITLEEVKTYLREDSEDMEVLLNIKNLIAAAIDYCEEKTKKAIQIRTYDYFIDKLKPKVAIPKPPLVSIEYIKLRDISGNDIVLEPSNYYVDADSEPGNVFINAIPSYNPVPKNSVVIRFKAGYEKNQLPMSIYQAILLLVSHWYENRGIVSTGNVSKEIVFTTDALLSTHKLYGW